MSAGGVGEVGPKEAWEALASTKPTLMIDVRTTAGVEFCRRAGLKCAEPADGVHRMAKLPFHGR